VERLTRHFFGRYSPDVARDLLGKRLVRVIRGRRLSGMVVETEAYRGSRDPASHAYLGRTRRNEVMFEGPGHAYVYFTMGLHYCLNLTTEPIGSPGAVLIRALEPVEGLRQMMTNRGVSDQKRMTNGPANLTQALKIDGSLNGEDVVVSDKLFVEEWRKPGRIGSSSRVGINRGTSYGWRFFVESNQYVSKGRPSGPAHRIHN